MFPYTQYIVIIGAVISLSGELVYIKNTIQGKTKPNRVTWFIWALAPIIASIASFSDGVGWAAVPVFMAGFGPLLVFLASFINKHAYWKLQTLDYVCGFFSILALVLWAVTKDPTIAVLLSIISDFLAGLPTIIKLWKYPETETVTPYTTGLLVTVTSFLSIQRWKFTAYAFPVFLVIIYCIQITAYYRKRIKSIFSSL